MWRVVMKNADRLLFLRDVFESKRLKCIDFTNMLNRKNIKFLNNDDCEINSMQFSSNRYRLLVATKRTEDWKNKPNYDFICYLSPDDAFDRWSNSRHIQFSVYGCRLSHDEFNKVEFMKDFDLIYSKVTWLADNIPIDYYNCGIRIEI